MSSRNKQFRTHEPFKDDSRLTLNRADGPFDFLNPTRAHFLYPVLSRRSTQSQEGERVERGQEHSSKTSSDVPTENVRFVWRSRDNRKGRHALVVQKPGPGEKPHFLVPRRTSHPREILKTVIRTFTCFPVWDISWLVAFIFTLGSVVWVINGFFAWLPLVAPSTEFHNEISSGGGITAFIGAICFFEIGSILLFFEAVNTNHSGCFGWAVEHLFEAEGANPNVQLIARNQDCQHHHQNRWNTVGKATKSAVQDVQNGKNESDPELESAWQWFPSWRDLRMHYLHELGFLAGLSQLFGATVFGISGITGLPGILDHLAPQSTLNGAYWIPQVIGGSGFIVSSTLYMLETQRKWYLPSFQLLGWHIAFWNLIGALGFTLCGALGMAYGNSGAQYQASLSTFWGSWAFLIGSYLQLYESLNKNPVEEVSTKEDFETRQ
ncbi:hypothetical protein ABW20_dc0109804 [Dactylellina cionopaga]|nr:hypothetical protein ABW20_dc0109804 [Dactylellina cionopaga]